MKLNNKGYTLNLTIILMIVVTIICTSCLAIVVANYSMKKSESDVSSSTYTAETAIDDIRAGIQQQCSADMKVVYTTLTSSMNTIPWNKLDDEFSALYKDRLSDKYSTKTAETLNSYIRAGSGYGLITEPTFEIKSDRKMFLRNIGVSYKTSSGNYTSKLYTDIEIDVPKLFDNMKTQTVNSTAYSDFVMIADGNISMSKHGNVVGSIYSGNDITVGGSISANKLLARGNLYFSAAKSELEKVTVDSESSDKTCQVYFTNLENVGGTFSTLNKNYTSLSINGDIYSNGDLNYGVSDDCLKLSGRYFGFEDESTINLNGTRSTLDMSGLTELYLAGTNYLDITQNALSTSDIFTTGDSLSWKHNQFNYLVPSVCIRDKDGNALPNPMSKEQYDAGFTVDFDKNKQNSEIDLGYYASGYKPIWISYKGQVFDTNSSYYAQDDNVCYLYLTFDTTAKAAKYSKLFSNSHSKLLDYEAKYLPLGNITIGEDTRLITKGNVLTYNNEHVTVLGNPTERLATYIDNSKDYYRLKRSSILSTLDENSSSELIDSVFDYIIDRDKLTSPVLYEREQKYRDTIDIVTYENADNSAKRHGGVIYFNYDKDKDYTVIIANCSNVTIKKNINGLVINTGSIDFGNRVTNFTGLLLSGQASRGASSASIATGGTNNSIELRSNLDGEYPLEYILYEASYKDNIRRYFKVLQGENTDVIPNIDISDTIKIRNRVTQ